MDDFGSVVWWALRRSGERAARASLTTLKLTNIASPAAQLHFHIHPADSS
jgi:hypothetical protein